MCRTLVSALFHIRLLSFVSALNSRFAFSIVFVLFHIRLLSPLFLPSFRSVCFLLCYCNAFDLCFLSVECFGINGLPRNCNTLRFHVRRKLFCPAVRAIFGHAPGLGEAQNYHLRMALKKLIRFASLAVK